MRDGGSQGFGFDELPWIYETGNKRGELVRIYVSVDEIQPSFGVVNNALLLIAAMPFLGRRGLLGNIPTASVIGNDAHCERCARGRISASPNWGVE